MALPTDIAADPADVYSNGLNAVTGDYWLPPIPIARLAAVARGERLDPAEVAELRARHERLTVETLGVADGVDPSLLEEAGWGVVFAHDTDPAIRDALRPLLDHRRAEAAAIDPRRYREYVGPDGHRSTDSSADFLIRAGGAPGQPVEPDKVPYYLLLVGTPTDIPFRFQYQLDVTHAVGRIGFDNVDAYARYASAVVATERQAAAERRMVLFGPRNDNDPATALSADHLITPLGEAFGDAAQPGWTVETRIGAGEATKATLASLMAGKAAPDLLFTAGHGMAFPNGHKAQLAHQGALVCQDWPGPVAWQKAVPQDFYLASEDVPADAGPPGRIAIFFACYGAGTPVDDDFVRDSAGSPAMIAPHAFLAGLPQRLLSHPAEPAVAVIGHVERAFGASIVWPRAGEQIGVFESALGALLRGARVGAAMEYFNDRFAALTTEFVQSEEEAAWGAVVDPSVVAGLWAAKNDARNYVILGDPAVRLPSAVRP